MSKYVIRTKKGKDYYKKSLPFGTKNIEEADKLTFKQAESLLYDNKKKNNGISTIEIVYIKDMSIMEEEEEE